MEAASAFSRKVRDSELLLIHAERHLDDLPKFFAQLVPSASLVRSALFLSHRLRHPIYDCLYLALAQREDTRMVTADVEFANVAHAKGFSHRVELLA